jgi:hypothetical protein
MCITIAAIVLMVLVVLLWPASDRDCVDRGVVSYCPDGHAYIRHDGQWQDIGPIRGTPSKVRIR